MMRFTAVSSFNRDSTTGFAIVMACLEGMPGLQACAKLLVQVEAKLNSLLAL